MTNVGADSASTLYIICSLGEVVVVVVEVSVDGCSDCVESEVSAVCTSVVKVKSVVMFVLVPDVVEVVV